MTKSEMINRLDEWIDEHYYDEYSSRTLKQYRRCVNKFIDWCETEEVTKDTMLQYKKYLTETAGSTASVNTWILIIDKYVKWLGHPELKLKKIKMQLVQSNEEVLSVSDFKRLLRFAKRNGDHQLYYIMKILAMTGIRISELRYFTVENLESNYIRVFNKGKERKIIVRQDLARDLKRYARTHGIKAGYLFPSPVKPDHMISVSTIWRRMKKTAGQAKVQKKKVHPHSFRHLFAQLFLEEYSGNITELADILGHSSLETTRVYTRTSDAQKKSKLERMKF